MQVPASYVIQPDFPQKIYSQLMHSTMLIMYSQVCLADGWIARPLLRTACVHTHCGTGSECLTEFGHFKEDGHVIFVV